MADAKYQATATREGRFWVVDVPGIGVTQGRSLAEARSMARDLIHAVTEEAPGPDDVEVRPTLTGERARQLAATRARLDAMRTAQDKAAAESRQLVAALIDDGLSRTDAADVIGISRQRVGQLLDH